MKFIKRFSPYLLLFLLCFALYFPGLTTIPPVDRDESRFAQASHQMLESKDFIRISFQDSPRPKKPVGIYWLQAASVAALGMSEKNIIWPYRIPSVLGAMIAVFLTFSFGRRFFDSKTAFLGAALTASSVLLVFEAHLATTDAMLLAAIITAQGILGLLYVRSRNGQTIRLTTALIFWTAQGVGILLKGPVLPS